MRICPKCGSRVYHEKYTGTGTEYRDYYCVHCDWHETENCGTAMWKFYEDANTDKGNAGKASPAAAPDSSEAASEVSDDEHPRGNGGTGARS